MVASMIFSEKFEVQLLKMITDTKHVKISPSITIFRILAALVTKFVSFALQNFYSTLWRELVVSN